jgi:hypothetical protein
MRLAQLNDRERELGDVIIGELRGRRDSSTRPARPRSL